jgi:hypothetical protein
LRNHEPTCQVSDDDQKNWSSHTSEKKFK